MVAEHQHLARRDGQPGDIGPAALAQIQLRQMLAEVFDLADAGLGQRMAIDAQVTIVQLDPIPADRRDALDQAGAVLR
ncbi:hypothetical protein D3C81_1924910 [compost metagenome]